MTTAPKLFNKSGTLSNSFSDHFPIYGVMKGKTNERKYKLISTRRYDQDRVEAFKKDLSSKTASSCPRSTNDIHQRWESTVAAINELVENRFPKSTKRIRHKTHSLICTDLLRLMRKRDRVRKQAINSGDDQLWKLYRKLRNQSTSLQRKQRKQYFKSTLEEKGREPRAF